MSTISHLIIKNRTKLVFLAFWYAISCEYTVAQVKTWKIKYNFIIDGGNRDGSKISIERDGQKWRTRDGDDGKNYIDLDYQHEYIFSFSKQGYVTKKIYVSTKVPQSIIKDGFDPYAFDITIFKQVEGVNIVVFNQPVARIIYNEDLDDFGFDTDYTKSVLAGIQDAEKELKKKTKELKSTTKAESEPKGQSGSQLNQAVETTGKNSSEGNASPSETTNKNSNEGDKKSSAGTEADSKNKLKGATDYDSKDKTKAQVEAENRTKSNSTNQPDKREERQYVDGNKRVTQVTIERNGRTFVYKKVVYIWGVFYFRDNINITESSFIQEAL